MTYLLLALHPCLLLLKAPFPLLLNTPQTSPSQPLGVVHTMLAYNGYVHMSHPGTLR